MIWNTDRGAAENGQVDLVNGFEQYNIPLTDKFKEVVERYTGENLLELGESLGFKFYQPVEKYDESFRFSLSALYEDKVILIILNDPTVNEKKDGFESTMQIDFAKLQDWVGT